MKTINEKDFETEVLKSDIPVIVDFYADWCGPCKQMGLLLEKLSPEYEGKVKIVKINVDDDPNLASQFGIQSIPSMYSFKNGEKLETKVGAQSPSKLAEWLASLAG